MISNQATSGSCSRTCASFLQPPWPLHAFWALQPCFCMTSVVAAAGVGDVAGGSLLAQPTAPSEMPAIAAAIRLVVIFMILLGWLVGAFESLSSVHVRRDLRAASSPVTCALEKAASWAPSPPEAKFGEERHPAIDVERRAGHVVRVVRCQPHHRAGQVDGVAHPRVRKEPEKRPFGVWRVPGRRIDRRPDRPGSH